MSDEDLISLFHRSKEKIKRIQIEIENTTIELSDILKKSSSLPPSPELNDVCSKLQKKIHELEIKICDEREHRNQIALELSRIKKQKIK